MAIFWGPPSDSWWPAHTGTDTVCPYRQTAKPSSWDTKQETNRKVIAVPKKERISSRWAPPNQILTRVKIQRTNSYKCFSPAILNMERKWPSPPSLGQFVQRDIQETGVVRTLLPAVFQRSRISNWRFQTEQGASSRWCPTLGARNCREEKISLDLFRGPGWVWKIKLTMTA